MDPQPLRLFYITDAFPSVSEVFISRELHGLERLGAEITLLSLQKPQAAVEHTINRQLGLRCYWDPDLLQAPIEKGFGHLSAFLTRPNAYLKILACSRMADLPSMRHLFRQLPIYARLIRESQAERIHCHFARKGMLVGWLASHLLGLPFSVTLHGSDILLTPYQNLGLLLADAEWVICVSEQIREVVRRDYGIAPRKLAVVRCGISPPDFLFPLRRPDRLRILCVARLHPVKGLHDLIAACALLRERQADFTCLIVGEGELRQNLQRQIIDQGLSGMVHLAGAIPNEKLPELYAGSSVFVLPSYSEGLPVVLLEAMASGLPVIATRVGGIPELVTSGENGLLVAPAQPESLAAAIQELATLPEPEIARMRNRNRLKVEKFFNAAIESRKLFRLFSSPHRRGRINDQTFFDLPHARE
ncbi:MAG: glycosyltransferase [Desulfuromonadales bacterium]|nr:glycosyltransferase [Desulfuromonadales bacterium]